MDLHFQLMGDLKVLENLTGKASIVSTRVAKNDGKARKTGSHTHSNIISILEQPETKSGCCTSQSRKQQLRRSNAERGVNQAEQGMGGGGQTQGGAGGGPHGGRGQGGLGGAPQGGPYGTQRGRPGPPQMGGPQGG